MTQVSGHLIQAQQFDLEALAEMFRVTREMKKLVLQDYGSNILSRRVMATLFYEPSTRTRLSFESAMNRLGGSVITTENAKEFSSAAKGETLEDSIRVVSGYADVIVLRHHETGASEQAAAVSTVPVINAGDGKGQHPTQGLLDLFTIQDEIGHLDGLKIAMCGDLLNGRTVRSLCYLLAKYDGVKIYFVAPKFLQMADDIRDYLKKHDVEFENAGSIMEIAGKVDVVYQTRIQLERMDEAAKASVHRLNGEFDIGESVVLSMQNHARILHPLPRVGEIHEIVDKYPQAAYFRQAHNGLYVRMAVLKMLLGR